jgi:hypothetical protein
MKKKSTLIDLERSLASNQFSYVFLFIITISKASIGLEFHLYLEMVEPFKFMFISNALSKV